MDCVCLSRRYTVTKNTNEDYERTAFIVEGKGKEEKEWKKKKKKNPVYGEFGIY